MKLELNLMELNSLYMAVSHQLEIAKKESKEYPSEFFNKQLDIAQELVIKVSEALYDEANRIDTEIQDYVHSMNEAQYEDRVLGNL